VSLPSLGGGEGERGEGSGRGEGAMAEGGYSTLKVSTLNGVKVYNVSGASQCRNGSQSARREPSGRTKVPQTSHRPPSPPPPFPVRPSSRAT